MSMTGSGRSSGHTAFLGSKSAANRPFVITRRVFLRRSILTGVALGLAVPWLPSPRPARAYEEGEVANGGTVKGRITYSKSVPTKMIVPDDPEVCGDPRKDPQIMLADDGGVQDAVVYTLDIKKGKPWAKMEPPRLDNRDCRFVPQMLAMNPGPLVIINSDPILHNTHIFYGRRTAINVALPNQGQEIEQSLERPGILRIECDEHGHMHAGGYVAANPYYSATGQSGEFEIGDVPPGEYTLTVYQRHTGPREVTVAVEPGKIAEVNVDLAMA